MSDQNGTALLPLARRPLRVVSETITYPIETDDGETVTLAGYRRGPGCPITIEIEVEGAWAEWSEDSPTDEDRAALTSHRYLAKTMRAERLLRRNLLCAVIPGLDQRVADVVAADGGPWEGILAELGWWQKAGDSAEGEAGAGDSSPPIGSPASPDSSAPTTASRSRTRRR